MCGTFHFAAGRSYGNVVTSIEKLRTKTGPTARLAHFMDSGKRIKVRTRNFGEVRGECTGFLEIFDKYWNLILRDVDEVFQRLVTTNDDLYDLGTFDHFL